MRETRSGKGGLPDYTVDEHVRLILTRAIARSSKSRAIIAEEMAERLHCKVTVSMLNDFTAEFKKKARFPAAWVSAFCKVVGSDELQCFLVSDQLRRKLTLAIDLAQSESQAEVELLRRKKLRDELIKGVERTR